ncbi:ABC transporter substrate binding protein [Methylomonas montana]|uniref:ABC transporter substrate-binding protein n=1 Tax=Methylomonas montana TaxID=3058963 RepID=UPI00265AF0CD|nr:ABC transporter substrate binding protein [Methylomonas montana]WKJ90336.1 ABC transporter substrate binding protein [Methylomonas montana]
MNKYRISIATRISGSRGGSAGAGVYAKVHAGRPTLAGRRTDAVTAAGIWQMLFRRRLDLICAVLIGCGFSARTLAATDILVFQSHDSPPYQQTLDGFKAGLAARGVEADYQIHILHNDAGTEAFSQPLQNPTPKLIVTLGTPATRTVLANERTIPVVAGLVLDTEELRKNQNACGVGLNFPAALQWNWFHRLLPEARQIAVIYDPRHGSALFQALQQQARAENATLIAAPAMEPEDLPSLLQSLPPQLDAIWAADGTAPFNSAAVRELLLYSFRNRTPLIGLSAQWVKAGAFYALDWDYADLGDQVAELASNVLRKGMSPAALTPQEPRKVRAVINSKTAEHMKLPLSERWLPEIAEVFQ